MNEFQPEGQIDHDIHGSSIWKRYTGHRKQLMNMVSSFRSNDQQTICILGAGSCADFDLIELSNLFKEVHLVDLDASKITRGVKSQGMENAPNIIIHGNLDITGVDHLLRTWRGEEPASAVVHDCILQVKSIPSVDNLSCGFDLVVSACVMTQLFHAAKLSRIPEDKQNQLIFSLRQQHILFMLSITKQNGISMLTTDMSSFETDQDFSSVESCDIYEMMLELIDKKAFLTGVNPFAIMNEVREKNEISSQIKDAIFFSPWLWQMFKRRIYLVYGLALLKK